MKKKIKLCSLTFNWTLGVECFVLQDNKMLTSGRLKKFILSVLFLGK